MSNWQFHTRIAGKTYSGKCIMPLQVSNAAEKVAGQHASLQPKKNDEAMIHAVIPIASIVGAHIQR